MDELFYQMIFKRKSFHFFKGRARLSPEELERIARAYPSFMPLEADIHTALRIVPRAETSCKRGEYCILLFSERKGNYLRNIGYLGEQLDLWLASENIGTCWYGMGKTQQRRLGTLEFVIMLAIEKAEAGDFRKDMFRSKRKPLEEMWSGQALAGVSDIVRFAPSACNTQPWTVEAGDGEWRVFRCKKPGKRGVMPADRTVYYNRIDIGIFLLFVELCCRHERIDYTRALYDDFGDEPAERALVASYRINGYLPAQSEEPGMRAAQNNG